MKSFNLGDLRLIINTYDMALLTSIHEGSPQFIKEAMACNRPVVSTDVGDVKNIFGNVAGCFITTQDKTDIADKIKLAFEFSNTKDGRQRIMDLGMDLKNVTTRVLEVYNIVLRNRGRNDQN